MYVACAGRRWNQPEYAWEEVSEWDSLPGLPSVNPIGSLNEAAESVGARYPDLRLTHSQMSRAIRAEGKRRGYVIEEVQA